MKTISTAAFLLILPLVVHGQGFDPVRVDANPAAGFHWPYYLVLPPNTGSSSTLLVEPNNTGRGDDDVAVHDEAAQRLAADRAGFAADLACPMLVPAFPRPYTDWQVYTHALDRDTLLTSLPNLQRVDLQLIAMIDDARARLAESGVLVGPKVFLMGFSASGMFVNRFALIHPDRVQAAAIGSPGGWPLAPVGSWQGHVLRYNVGIADLVDLTGAAPDIDAFVKVPLFFFLGDQDTNDSVPYGDSYEEADTTLVNSLFGTTPLARWPQAEQIYKSIAANARFVTYPDVGHSFTTEMQTDVKRFFAPDRRWSQPHIAADIVFSIYSDRMRIEWATLIGLDYRLKISSDLRQWTDSGLSPVSGDGAPHVFESAMEGVSTRFFRIVSKYVPPSDSQGRFIALLDQSITLRCSGLDSGPVLLSDGGSGTFSYASTGASSAQLRLDLDDGDVIICDLDLAVGQFTATSTSPGDAPEPFDGRFEMLVAP